MRPRKRNGVMEYWGAGVLKTDVNFPAKSPITPLLQDSIPRHQILHHSLYD